MLCQLFRIRYFYFHQLHVERFLTKNQLMKNNTLVLIVIALCLSFASCLFFTSCEKEKVVNHYFKTLQPDGTIGLDAFLADFVPDGNYGTFSEFDAMAWTNGGTPVIVRSIMKFDYSSIPIDAMIDSVKLSLYSFQSPTNGSHSTLSGSNLCVLQKVISNWNEDLVTWNNQPLTTTENQIVLFQSEAVIQHYLDLNVTTLLKGMIENRDTNYGFMIKLDTEEHYRSMVFASSDNEDSSLHPRLVIYYSLEE